LGLISVFPESGTSQELR